MEAMVVRVSGRGWPREVAHLRKRMDRTSGGSRYLSHTSWAYLGTLDDLEEATLPPQHATYAAIDRHCPSATVGGVIGRNAT